MQPETNSGPKDKTGQPTALTGCRMAAGIATSGKKIYKNT
jgi:hypothetical protein